MEKRMLNKDKFIRFLFSIFFVFCLVFFCASLVGTIHEKKIDVQFNAEQKKVKVLIVCSDDVADEGFNQLAWDGMSLLKEHNEYVDATYIDKKIYKEFDNIPNMLDGYVKNEYNLIIGVGYEVADAIRKSALKYKNVHFGIVDDAANSDLSNVACLMFSNFEMGYLAGSMAALMTKTNVIGYIQGNINDVMNDFGYGYLDGAKATNNRIKVVAGSTNSFEDDKVAREIATDMIDNKSDVIFSAAGYAGNGSIEVCEERDKYAIGVDVDQKYLAPKNVVASVIKRVDNAIIDLVLNELDGKFEGGVYYNSLSNSGIDIIINSRYLTNNISLLMQMKKNDILNGNIIIKKEGLEFIYGGTSVE